MENGQKVEKSSCSICKHKLGAELNTTIMRHMLCYGINVKRNNADLILNHKSIVNNSFCLVSIFTKLCVRNLSL